MTAADRTSTASCPARAALAGNPSDGHGGAVVAMTVNRLNATVEVTDADVFRIDGTIPTFRSVDQMAEYVTSVPTDIDHPLIPAALIALREHLGADLQPVAIELETTIPRSVGLAGSSAIIIATLRAIARHRPHESWSRRLDDDPSLLASLALAAERDVLGIAAGLQDRVVQSFGGTVAMEFGEAHLRTIDRLAAGTYRSLAAPPGALAIAYRPDTGGDSGAVHRRPEGTDPAFVATMAESAEQARRAFRAIDAADRVALGRAMDATFDLRASVMDLDVRHVQMIEVARAHGASANYTGSGGAVVVLAADQESLAPICAALRHDLGCLTVPIP
ncbi:mevalonate kinase family protein [Ilumatobacter nonamiensis]|uniref:mevalonate kinase family protein n=1 Tax=Ilumatobacter nonamiensis TaxID=467093 RepID=UPI000347B4BC|nr:hypothetical protein [Ilumatobacter nonamiensis]